MSNETEMRAILQELHGKFNTRVYGTSSYIKRDMRDRIAAALATPAPAQPDPLHVANERGEGWQPIETAPKDGRTVIVVWGELVTTASWLPCGGRILNGKKQNWVRETFGLSQPTERSAPTYWMPLPAAPKEKP